eukprot:jgi/Ulvmu1/8488/UM044_0022.1
MSKVKNRIRPGNILVSDSERAIIVEYEQETFELNDDGSIGQSLGKSNSHKRLKVKSLTAESNIDEIAQEMIEKCKLLKPSSLSVLKAALEKLQSREAAAPAVDTQVSQQAKVAVKERMSETITSQSAGHVDAAEPSLGDGAQRHQQQPKKSRREKMSSESKEAKRTALEEEHRQRSEQSRKYQEQLFASQDQRYGSAELELLDKYMEELYEDDQTTKIHGLGMIAQLFRHTANFAVLLSKPGLMQLLARTLREEGKKSTDVAVNAVTVFFSLSNFSALHGIIMDNQVGAMTLDLVALEIQRTELRTQEHGLSPSEIAAKVMESQSGMTELTVKERKLINVIQKQDRMLYMCFYLLLNLAEDAAVERKMKKKGIVSHLLRMLERSNVELLILAVTFLKKLSIYKDNKDQMLKGQLIQKLHKFIPVHSAVLLMAILRLLHNLAFDKSARAELVASGVVPKLVDIMQEPRFGPVCMGILYHISMDDSHKSLFVYTEPPAMAVLYERLMAVPDVRREPELIALAVNLTQNTRCAAALVEGPKFDRLMKRAMERRDDLLFKVMRNVSQVDDLDLKRRYSPYVERCVLLLKDSDVSAELFVEVLGCLANLSLPEFDFGALVRRHDLLNFLSQFVEPDAVDDDILLEVVMFIGVLCSESTAEQIAATGLVETLFGHMGAKKDDDEFVLQLTFTFSKLLSFEATAASLLQNTDILYYLVDLLQDKNKEVRKHADKALDVLLERQPDNESVIRELKFKTFNQEWLDVVDQNVDTSNLPGRPHGLSLSASPAHEGLYGLFDGLEEAQVLQLLDGDGLGGAPEAAEGGPPGTAASGSAAAMLSELVTLPVDDDEAPPLEEGVLQGYV